MQAISKRGRVLTGNGGPRTSSEAGALHPALPAVVLLVSFAVFMAAIAPLNFSAVLDKIFPFQVRTLKNPNAVVWVSKTAGTYFCAESVMFGKADGKYMKQAEALDSGYQPALGTFCQGPDWAIPARSHSSTSGNSSNMPPNPLTSPMGQLLLRPDAKTQSSNSVRRRSDPAAMTVPGIPR